MGGMMVSDTGKQPPEYEAPITEQQRVDPERRFEYAKKTLGVGVRWKTA